jgi:hypothetical protein
MLSAAEVVAAEQSVPAGDVRYVAAAERWTYEQPCPDGLAGTIMIEQLREVWVTRSGAAVRRPPPGGSSSAPAIRRSPGSSRRPRSADAGSSPTSFGVCTARGPLGAVPLEQLPDDPEQFDASPMAAERDMRWRKGPVPPGERCVGRRGCRPPRRLATT